MTSKKVTINIAGGEEVKGTKLEVPGWEHIDLVLSRIGDGIVGYTVYECTTGVRVFPITEIIKTRDEAIACTDKYLKIIEERNQPGGVLGALHKYVMDNYNGEPLNGVKHKQRRLL